MPSHHGLIPGNFYHGLRLQERRAPWAIPDLDIQPLQHSPLWPQHRCLSQVAVLLLTCFTLATSRIKDSSST